jgi:hypothetical protein
MRRVAAFVALALGALAAGAAYAGETACWVDNGVVVVPAALGDIAGDFILDLSAPQSQLHFDVAGSNGITAPTDEAPLQLAGEHIPALSFAVAHLDARGWGFPTNIAGVIGADALAGYVVDLQLSPCRLTLWRGLAPKRVAGQTLSIQMIAGAPAVSATVSDGRKSRRGLFALDSGSAGVRIADSEAALSRLPKGLDPTLRTNPPARIAGLDLGDDLIANAPASLQADTPPGLVGSLGNTVWSRFAWIRVDLRADKLALGPPSSPRPSR